jgi:hypothetical protein
MITKFDGSIVQKMDFAVSTVDDWMSILLLVEWIAAYGSVAKFDLEGSSKRIILGKSMHYPLPHRSGIRLCNRAADHASSSGRPAVATARCAGSGAYNDARACRTSTRQRLTRPAMRRQTRARSGLTRSSTARAGGRSPNQTGPSVKRQPVAIRSIARGRGSSVRNADPAR